MRAVLLGLLAVAAAAQDQTGRIEGVVLDAVSHQPVKKATVLINFTGGARGQAQPQSRQAPVAPNTPPITPRITTDTTGTFAFDNLPVGLYQLVVIHQNYPQARMGGARKSVQVSQGDANAKITVELVPGAIVTGRVVDEDGDPLGACRIQPRAAKSFNQFVPAIAVTGSDGTYRLVNVPPGKYIMTAQCSTPVFQPRTLSEGPDPPPTAAYPIQFYAGADDLKSAEIVELAAATEKSGVDFQLRPIPATRIHGTIAAADADLRGRDDLMAQLLPLDRKSYSSFTPSDRINPATGTFEIRQVFPGSYRLVVLSLNTFRYGNTMRQISADLVGGMVRVDVSDKPVEISLPLHHAVDIQGSIEIEGKADTTNQITAEQISVQLTSEYQVGPYPAAARVSDDRSFIIKSILPGEWRISLAPPSVFVKSAWYGNDDVTHRALEWKPGSATPLRIVVSSNTATIRGTAPASQSIFAIPTATGDPAQTRSWQADSNGQFTIKDLAPGSYRVVGAEAGTSPPDEGGREVTIREGETLSIDVKPDNKP